MAYPHAPTNEGRERRPKVKTGDFSIRKSLTSIAATALAVALAASVAIPVTSASADLSATPTKFSAGGPALTVSDRATVATITRDGFTIVKPRRQAGPTIAALGGWTAPTKWAISSPFGPRASICTGGGCTSGFHAGDDFAGTCNAPFFAASAGTVVSASYAGTEGEKIVIQNAGNITTSYSHMFAAGVLVAVGDKVTAGQNIGLVGSSGTSTGCHLYFQYLVSGTAVDPVAAMLTHGIQLG
jgi:murein DD-endopeptidase MepM/ murein hydrolase activator NlpD